jgi:hypothetical protein
LLLVISMIYSSIALFGFLGLGFGFNHNNIADTLAPKKFPWGESLEDRQNQILKALRKDISLDVLVDYLPQEGMTEIDPLFFKNGDGKQFSCVAHEELDSEVSRQNISISEALHRLGHSCVAFPIDWWSYEWCYQREVKQFHMVPSRRGPPRRDPEWSLGVFDNYDVKFDADGTPNELTEYFSGGQICDENGDLRSSEVRSSLSCGQLVF